MQGYRNCDDVRSKEEALRRRRTEIEGNGPKIRQSPPPIAGVQEVMSTRSPHSIPLVSNSDQKLEEMMTKVSLLRS